MSAMINPGIVKFKERNRDLERWLGVVTKFFSLTTEGQKEVRVIGDLDDVLQFEEYLVDKFPNDPSASLEIDEHHFDSQDIKIALDENKYFALQKFLFSGLPKGIKTFTYNMGSLVMECEANQKKDIEKLITKCLRKMCLEKIYLESEMLAKTAAEALRDTDPVCVRVNQNEIVLICLDQESLRTFRQTVMQKGAEPKLHRIMHVGNLKVTLLEGDLKSADAECILINCPAKINCNKGAAKAVQEMVGEGFLEKCSASVNTYGNLGVEECRIFESGLGYRKYVACVRMPNCNAEKLQESLISFEKALLSALREVDKKKCQSMAMTCIGSGMSSCFIIAIYDLLLYIFRIDLMHCM